MIKEKKIKESPLPAETVHTSEIPKRYFRAYFQDDITRHMLYLFIVNTKEIYFLQLKARPTANYIPSSISSSKRDNTAWILD